MKLCSTAIMLACILSVVGCSPAENATPVTESPGNTVAPTRSLDVADTVTWDLSGVESYFKVVGAPRFDAAQNAFVVILEAIEDGSCALKPPSPSATVGFEAIFIGDSNRKIHVANDAGSAAQMLASAEAYTHVAPDRIRVEPQQWTVGTKITLTIAGGLDSAIQKQTRRIEVFTI